MAARYVVIGGTDAKMVRELTTTLEENEKITNLSTKDLEKILRPYEMTAHSIKRGALAHAPTVVFEHDLDPRFLTQLGKTADPLEFPRSTERYLGHCVALINKSEQLTQHMQRSYRDGLRPDGCYQLHVEKEIKRHFRDIAF
ncbi:hypothetical protein, unlikely [Trypanosoma brucei gambiense DAL972]|uniref:Uncharacterized protein n=1 Tax=Trypanosoma brucei gambiense (strain MHOM/CI/86/DAL972) TaxID=679716 RepID=D0A905_TRYB9|nr:hypothetical protein, unlikely [Trypanosoma brucei gambiense DAL972]CBH18156.1 hypothetical protein, unlikely [Trypanosoma brucei gambiense DAL972]|eukprot:XP_011780420.1 hypothetical protein, unlikely [Trypanosoma brucei gambiense DAL972]